MSTSKSTLPHLKEGVVAKFSYTGSTKQALVDLINKVKPINLKKNADLVNKVAERYPHISKAQITIIVKYTFAAIRDALLLGKILYIHDLFHMMHIHFFRFARNNAIYSGVKVVVKTPKDLK